MNTESLIADLVKQARPVKRLPYLRVCAEWISITFISFVLTSLWYGFRSDLLVKLTDLEFILEIILNLMVILFSGCCATAFSYPDRAKARFLKPMLGVIFSGYTVLTLIISFRQPDLTAQFLNMTPHGIECLFCILSFAVLPALWMFYRLRHLATVKPMQTGGAVLMMAIAVGCLGVRLVETEIESTTLILWHYLPLVIFSGLGLMLGKRLFKW